MGASRLNSQQLQAVRHYQGPMLVVAGAGTGKTQVITRRVAHLINRHNIPPSQILAVTFTEKAASEMETRVTELLKKYVLDVKITTFNAFGYEVVRRFAYELGMDPNLQLLSSAQQLVFLKDQLDELKLDYYSPVTNPDGMLTDLAAYFSKLRSQLVSVKEYLKFARGLKTQADNPANQLEASRHLELATAYKYYQQLKRQHNFIDFDDQVGLAVELLENFPNIRQKLQQEIKYILVDEFQDTNSSQSRLVDLLAAESSNIMVVGDDDQSIYRFRGAAIVNILQFLERYPQAKQVSLTQNYRSSQQILDAAHRLIRHNDPNRLEAKYQINKQLIAQFVGSTPKLRTFLTHDEEAKQVATDIKQRLEAGQDPLQIAILIRKNNQADIVAKYLQAQGIDYHIAGRLEDLYAQPVVKLLLNFLRAVTDPRDAESIYHLMTSDAYQLDPAWLRQYVSRARRRQQTLEEVLTTEVNDNTVSGVKKLQSFLQQLQQFRQEIPKSSVGQLSFMFLKESGYLHRLIQSARTEPALDEKVAALNQFFSSLREYEAVAQDTSAVGYAKTLPSLLGSGERLSIEDLPELFDQKIIIMTVHKAKGLEFETVYLFDLSQEAFPARRQSSSLELPEELSTDRAVLSQDPHLLEERRLMYVAMTRAKKELIISYSPDHGGRRARKPSVFIEEALGIQPALTKLKSPVMNISQIELFKPKTANSQSDGRRSKLPVSMQRGNTLLLTQGQIDDYLMCPAEFYLRHVLSPPQPLTFALEYGNLMHGLIQFYNRRRLDKQPVDLARLQSYLEANWPQETFISSGHRQRSLAQAKRTLDNFWQREQRTSRYPSQIEQTFEFEVPEINTRIRGRFDAVYQADTTEIRDYKTGAIGISDQAKADQKAKNSFQLGLYALAWKIINGQAPDVLTLDFIDSGLIGRATKSPRQLQTVEDKIKRAATGIRTGDFRPANTHLFCTHPEYGF